MTKIDAKEVDLIPPHIGEEGLCFRGNITEEVQDWCSDNSIESKISSHFTNLIIPKEVFVQDLFNIPEKYEYLDGFSPNLNKHLHLGHLSNMVLAKAFQSLGVANKGISILGDTLVGDVKTEEALEKFMEYCAKYGYHVSGMYFASKMQLSDSSILLDGSDKYKGTKVFDVSGNKIVGIKSDGSTSYFYQDVALAQILNSSTLYLTGSEQNEHFQTLKNIFPNIDHVGLGLVTLNGKKQSSREGNVIYAEDVFNELNNIFNDDQVSFNVIAGQILKSNPKSTKDINMDLISNPKSSLGLYISYTTARLKSAGIEPLCNEKFTSIPLGFSYIKSLKDKSPNHLFNSLGDHCKSINSLYKTHRIDGNIENKEMFTSLMKDLELGLKLLGLFSVTKI